MKCRSTDEHLHTRRRERKMVLQKCTKTLNSSLRYGACLSSSEAPTTALDSEPGVPPEPDYLRVSVLHPKQLVNIEKEQARPAMSYRNGTMLANVVLERLRCMISSQVYYLKSLSKIWKLSTQQNEAIQHVSVDLASAIADEAGSKGDPFRNWDKPIS